MIWFSAIISILFTFGFFYLIVVVYRNKIKNSKSIWLKFEGKLKHKKLTKISFIALTVFMGSIIHFASFILSNRITFFNLNLTGNSKWIDTNGQKYLYIEADNYYDLGYHTGYHLSTEIVKMKYLIYLYTPMIGVGYSNFEDMCLEYLPHIPENYKREIQGISDGATAGGGFYISFEDIVVQSVFYEVLYGKIVPSKSKIHTNLGCTAFGSRNSNGTVLIGQNMDLIKPFSWIDSFVLHKVKDECLVFTYRLGGCPALPMGKNEYGLTLTTNLVQTNIEAPVTRPTFVIVREGLRKNKSITAFYETLLANNKSAYSRNFLIANNSAILAVQCLPENHTLLSPATTIVQSNTFMNPYWQKNLIDLNYSKYRQNYAENLVSYAFDDSIITNIELLNILRSEPIIFRDETGLFGTKTVAFMTMNSFGLIGSGQNVGVIPI